MSPLTSLDYLSLTFQKSYKLICLTGLGQNFHFKSCYNFLSKSQDME